MSKHYKVGMYGGKFLPFHKGHAYCLREASEECDVVYLLMFYAGQDECNAICRNPNLEISPKARENAIKAYVEREYPDGNVIFRSINVYNLRDKNGNEDWDAETPFVRAIIGRPINAIYSSEPKYGNYFKRAYPEAVHRVVDPGRQKVPISSTMLRRMTSMDEIMKWIP